MLALRPWLLAALFLLAMACNDEEVEPIVFSVDTFAATPGENPQSGAVTGTFNASVNRGTMACSLSDVNPAGAIAINATSGEITVANSAFFYFETNPTITAVGRQ